MSEPPATASAEAAGMTDPASSAPVLPALTVTDATNTTTAGGATISAATSEASLASGSTKASGIKPPTAVRIGRPCCSHGAPKAGPPPLPEPHSDTSSAMRRQQSDEYARSHLPDVFEESEADLMVERTDRSTKSRSPSEGGSLSGSASTGRGQRTDRKVSNGSLSSEHYLEATGNRRNSDQSVVLTTDTDSFIIGQRIFVGGHRPGHIAYIGETHFAPGDWAGIVLDDPSGKNDGCVSCKRYFQCEPKRGIFSRLTRLTREPLANASSGDVSSLNVSSMSMASPGRSGATSPTQSMRSYATGLGRTPSKGNLAIGDRVIVSSGLGSRPGILKYIGETHFASGNWCGVQLDEPTGKNDGSIDNQRYFECPPNYGVFVPLAKVSLSPSSRKTRLSRAGSKESLTSVGTIGSMASTVTSRMRLSGVQQRLSTPAKPITTPKHTLALQDILREKQNHIEQLILERDLEKQDAEGQIITYQNNIAQLREQIVQLEKRLIVEAKKTEDLQASVEEATFCGDELNAQTQEYCERITKLEAQLAEATTAQSGAKTVSTEAHRAEVQTLAEELAAKTSALENTQTQLKQRSAELAALQDEIKDSEADKEIKLSSLAVSETCLREEIKYFESENEQLKAELRQKDESTEKEYLAMKHIEHEMREELVSLQEQLKVHETSKASKDGELHRLVKEKDAQIGELRTAAAGSVEVHQLELSHKLAEIETLKATLNESSQTIIALTNDRSNDAENAQKQQLTIAQLQNSIEEFTSLVAKLQNEAVSNQEIRESLKVQLDEHSKSVAALESASQTLRDENTAWSTKFQELKDSNQNLNQIVVKEKDELIQGLNEEVAKLAKQLSEITVSKTNLEAEISGRDQQIEENELLIAELQSNFKEVNASNASLQKELSTFKDSIHNKDEVFAKISAEVATLTASNTEGANEIQRLRNESDGKAEEYNKLQALNAELMAELEKLRHSSENDSAVIVQLKEEIGKLNETTHSQESTVALMIKEIAELTEQLKGTTDEKAKIQQDLIEKKSALEGSQSESAQKLQEVVAAQQEIVKLQQTIATNESDLEKTQKSIVELTEKLSQSDEQSNERNEVLSKLEVEHADLKRQIAIVETKLEESVQQKASLQQNLDALQCSSSDTNSEIRRLTEELQTAHATHSEIVDKSNAAQLSLERKLHEQTQNLGARTTQWERVKEEMETLTTQKIDRENELNLELAKIKEASEGEKESLVNEINALRASFDVEKERLKGEVDQHLIDADGLRGELAASMVRMETTIEGLKVELEKSRIELQSKEKEFGAKIISLEGIQLELQKKLEVAQQTEEQLRSSLENAAKSGANENATLVSQLQQQNDQIQSLAAQSSELQAKLNDSSTKALSSETRLHELNLEHQSLVESSNNESGRLNATIAELSAKVEELTEQFRITEDDQVDLVNKNLEMVDQNTLLRQQLSESEEKLTEIGIHIKNLQSDQETKTASLTESECNLKLNQEIISEQKQELVSNAILIAELQNKLAVHVESFESVQQTLAQSQEHVVSLKSASESTQQQISNQLQAVQLEADNKQSQIQALQDTIKQLTSSVNLSDDLKAELSKQSEELRTKESNIIALSVELEQLKHERETSHVDLKRVQSELEEQRKEEQKQRQSHMTEVSRLQDKIEALERNLQSQVGTVTEDKTRLEGECDSLNALITQQQLEFEERMKQYEERSKFEALRDELVAMEATKEKEVQELTGRLLKAETMLAGQTESIQRLDSVQRNEKDLQYEKVALERREQQLQHENRLLTERIHSMKVNSNTTATVIPSNYDEDSSGQIAFLNSIIADMQKKNETLLERITVMEMGPEAFMKNGIFDVPIRREPAPRMFCDICDVFDAHETEDCPLQASDSPPPHTPSHTFAVPATPGGAAPTDKKERKIPAPRKYCDLCESFGHEASECEADETF